MHKFLRSVGFKSWTSKEKLKEITDWVLDAPDRLSIVNNGPESDLAVAERELPGYAGVAVVGEIDERGQVVPEYYFPYLTSAHISSDARLTYERESTKNGFIGMCEDLRLGMALIFSVRNLTEIIRHESEEFGRPFTRVCISALASDGTVILPLLQSEKVLKTREQELQTKIKLLDEVRQGNPEAAETLAQNEFMRYQQVMKHINDTDVFSMVDNFFMPYGMSSDQYYFMGRIMSCQLLKNPLTQEEYYRMLVDSNGMEIMVSVNKDDLMGEPRIGCRLKCHAWLQGELKY